MFPFRCSTGPGRPAGFPGGRLGHHDVPSTFQTRVAGFGQTQLGARDVCTGRFIEMHVSETRGSSANGVGLGSETGCILLYLTGVTRLRCVPKRDWIVFLRCPLWFLYVSGIRRSWQSCCWLHVSAEAYAKRSLTEASHFFHPHKVDKVKRKQPSIDPGKKNTGILSHVFLFR